MEILLAVANRPNHGPDRQTRAVACECLRQIEIGFPRLLSDVSGHLWSLAQAERTHAAQSYVLLLATVVRNIVLFGLMSSANSVLSSNSTLVPFNAPRCLLEEEADAGAKPTEQNLREIRRVMAFLLERPQGLTPQGTMELVSTLVEIAGELEQHIPAVAALLKVQFSGLIYSYDPVLCHVVLMLHSRFADSFAGDDETGIAKRLALIPKDAHHPLVFRLLALHWLLGSPRLANEKGYLAGLTSSFYPTVFDPLALKALKLDAMTYVSAKLDASGEEAEASVVKLFEDSLVCVSAFKWLPPWSTETAVAFRTLHKFLIGVAPHHDNSSSCNGFGNLEGSTIFRILKVL